MYIYIYREREREMCVCMYVCTRIYMCAYCICAYAMYVCICMCVCMHACMCVHVHVYTYLYIPSYEEIHDAHVDSIKATSVISDAQDVSCTGVCENHTRLYKCIYTYIYIYIYIYSDVRTPHKIQIGMQIAIYRYILVLAFVRKHRYHRLRNGSKPACVSTLDLIDRKYSQKRLRDITDVRDTS